jgi:hypothetical protein
MKYQISFYAMIIVLLASNGANASQALAKIKEIHVIVNNKAKNLSNTIDQAASHILHHDGQTTPHNQLSSTSSSSSSNLVSQLLDDSEQAGKDILNFAHQHLNTDQKKSLLNTLTDNVGNEINILKKDLPIGNIVSSTIAPAIQHVTATVTQDHVDQLRANVVQQLKSDAQKIEQMIQPGTKSNSISSQITTILNSLKPYVPHISFATVAALIAAIYKYSNSIKSLLPLGK